MHGKIIPATQPFACQWCGKQFWIAKRTGRPSKFCSDQCRNKHFRCNKRAAPSDPTGCNESPPKTTATAKACKRGFPDRPTIDVALFWRIVRMEKGWAGGREITSSGGCRNYIVRARPGVKR